MLYRLASSPGARALLGLPARRGRLVRPLLGLTREQLRSLAEAAGLPFADDPSNADPRFARSRLRTEVLPVLREINPAAEENIAATRAELAEDSEALESLAAGLLEQAGAARGATARPGERARGRSRGAAPPGAARPGRAGRGPPGRPRARRGGGDLAAGEPPRGRRAGARRRTERGLRGRLRALQRRRGGGARAGAGRSRGPRRGPLRALAGAGRAAPAAGPSHRARRSRPSTPPCSATGSRSAPGARATGCARSGCRAARASRTCSPTPACRARCAARCRWSPPGSGSPGSPGSPSRRSSSSARARPQVVLLSAALADPG